MKLGELAAGVPGARVDAGGDREVRRVTQDSRRAGPGDVFVAVRGLRVDGHEFARGAAERGAAVALERDVPLPGGTPVVRLPDTRLGLGELAAELHGRPARRLLVAGVTGTDGKTTVTHLAAHVLSAAGLPAGLLSTVAHDAGEGPRYNDSGQSTMEAPEVQAALASMVAAGRRAAVVEATSHALVQGRVAACEFDAAGFTHVGRDHLDYHATWDAYLEAKAGLIDLCRHGHDKGVAKTAVLNRDDAAAYGALRQRAIPRRWAYSFGPGAEVVATDLRDADGGTRFRLQLGGEAVETWLCLPARYNVANALCAAGLCLALGLTPRQVAGGIARFPGLPGRMERVDAGQPFRVYVDFAHAAEALASVLAELRRGGGGGRLLLVFGSTARSDHDRPGMGRAAAEGADWFVITTDDPVDEDPAAIAAEVEAGARAAGRTRGTDYELEPDRAAAIRRAIAMARPGDVVLLAGKGHERSMILAGHTEPWNERAEAERALRSLGYTAC
jgi:UDP-N-acetylmuramoyl-L-alanyl-D-glutamate--2,6-diaminopimelate ligase